MKTARSKVCSNAATVDGATTLTDSYPVELVAPDITPYRAGNAGLDYVTTFDSGRAGPHVVAAVTHGNELCGAITLDFLFRQDLEPDAVS